MSKAFAGPDGCPACPGGVRAKASRDKIKQQDEVTKGVAKREEALANGILREKEINEEMRGRLAIAKQAMDAQVAQAEEATNVARQKITDLIKETAEKVAEIKNQAIRIMQMAATSAAADAGNQAALISVAPGAIVHSNHLTPQMFVNAVLANSALVAHPELTQLIAQVSIEVVNGQALMVPAPTQPGEPAQAEPPKKPEDTPAAVQQQVEPIAAQYARSSQEEAGLQQKSSQDPYMEELTDGTDSGEDLINPNSDQPPIRKKNKISKAAKQARAEATTGGGAAPKIAKTKPAKK